MARAVRVMHFADTHFGVELYGRLDPDTGLNTRLKDFKRSLLKAVDLALEAKVDLAVFAGDAYKTRDPRQTDQREFADCIRRLTTNGVPVVMIAGNHDMPAVRGRANAVEIYHTLGVDNVYVLRKPESLLVETRAGTVRVAAMPYLIKGYSIARDEFMNKTLDETRLLLEQKYVDYIEMLAEEVRDANDTIPTILLGHFWANGAKLSTWQEGYFTIGEPKVAVSSLTNPAFDYVALGHIHKHQDLNRDGQPHVVYSGSPDRIDFGEKDERKGFVLADVYKGGADYKFIPVDEGRALLEIEVDASGEDPTEQILTEVKRHSLRNNIVKLTYKIEQAKLPLVREREIREALAPAFMVVSINRKVQRSGSERGRAFTESLNPRDALSLYIDSNEKLKVRKEELIACAEPLFAELAAEETDW